MLHLHLLPNSNVEFSKILAGEAAALTFEHVTVGIRHRVKHGKRD